ncbi:MAG: AAA family ATPase, partial [Candidatus Dormibacteraeota bacterium]|nr:AAA family ATPase [Candidatus Dormibacteraeota bacterium]
MSATAIPIRLSSFVGRRRELTELRRLLGHTRILTLLGPGGAGKTRLATELGRQLGDRYPDGVFFVDLSGVRDGALVGDAMARAAGVAVQGGSPMATLVRQLRDRQVLLLLDNCEQVVGDAALAAAEFLAGCVGCTVIATSRERLNVEGEVCWSIPPLTLPPAEGAPREGDSDALALFVDRARQVRPQFFLGST